MFPPRDLRLINLVREPKTEALLILTPHGDTYELELDEFERWLRFQYKWADDLIMALASYVWNFYSCMVDLSEQRWNWISLEDALNAENLRRSVVSNAVLPG